MKTRSFALVLACLLGCGDDDGGPQADASTRDAAADANPATMRPACDYQTALRARLDNKTPEVDCGQVSMARPITDPMTGMQCVLDAIAAGKSYALVVGDNALVVTERTVYLGTPKLASIFQYSETIDISAPGGGSNEVSSVSCTKLVQKPGCTPAGHDVCLVCEGEIESGVLCTKDTGLGCNPAGNYDRMNGAVDRPCCAGLQRVEQRSKLGDSCTFESSRLFACIEGFCGDGRCEPQEQITCGCALDCPAVTN